jgi:AcrR family transcriptional regulator
MTDAAAPQRGRRTARVTGDDRQLAILATAERLLDEREFRDITIDDLARGAGISRPTFYFYFASKEAVLLTLLDRVAREAGARTAHVFDRLGDEPGASWRRGIEAFAETFSAHRGVTVAAVAARAEAPELAAQWSRLLGRWIDATARGIEAERERGASPGGPGVPAAHRLATSLNLLNERVILLALTEPEVTGPLGEAVDTLLHVWLTSIYGHVAVDGAQEGAPHSEACRESSAPREAASSPASAPPSPTDWAGSGSSSD